MDIKKFFAPAASKKKQDSGSNEQAAKRKRRIEESDNDDDFQSSLPRHSADAKVTPNDQKTSTSTKSTKSGGSNTVTKPGNKESAVKDIVDPNEFFGSSVKKSTSSRSKLSKKADDDPFTPLPDEEGLTPKKAKKTHATESQPHPDPKPEPTVSTDKKKSSFRSLLTREGPKALGSRPLPQGKDNCFDGLTFVMSGEFETMTKDTVTDIIKRYGGRVTSAVSGKTSYLIRGRDAGETKTQKANKLGTKIVDEDGFYNLVESSAEKSEVKPEVLEEAPPPKKKSAATTKTQHPPPVEDANIPSSPSSLLWTEKYKPTGTSEILGNKELVRKIKEWLNNWQQSLSNDFKGDGDDMSRHRAILISGPPGIGKTTTVQVVAQECGYEALEFNASDVRSKKVLEENITEMMDNRTMTEFFSGDRAKKGKERSAKGKKVVLIMDEVDGMSAGDRGGAVEMAALIRKSKIPVFCICNDVRAQKVKPLLNVCYDARFKRTPAAQLRSRLMTIAFREKLKMSPNAIDELVSATGNDIRQIINIMSTYRLAHTDMDYDQAKSLGQVNHKSTQMNLFEMPGALFNGSAWRNQTLAQKSDIYFHDYSLAHLMVFENYTKTTPEDASRLAKSGRPDEIDARQMELLAKASEAIAEGDLVDAMIHGSVQQYSLMPVHSIFSCVRPASFIKGSNNGRPNFPGWLGQNSKAGKYDRLLSDIQTHMRPCASGDKDEVRQHYVPVLTERIFGDLAKEQFDDAIAVMDHYYLDKENIDTLSELHIGGKPPMSRLSTKAKTAFSRAFNSANHPILFQLGGGTMKKSISVPKEDLEGTIFEEEPSESETETPLDDDDDIGTDKLIKENKKRKQAANSQSSKKPSKAKQKSK